MRVAALFTRQTRSEAAGMNFALAMAALFRKETREITARRIYFAAGVISSAICYKVRRSGTPGSISASRVAS